MWDRPKFEKVAETIAEEYLGKNRTISINDISAKIAADNNLNPEQIRTMVRLANVATFQKVFEKKGSNNDDMVEFEPGDPELVIQKLYSDVKTAAEAVYTAPRNEAERLHDFYGDLYPKKQVMEKVAHVVPEVNVDVNELKLLLKKADHQLDIDARQAEFRWQDAMEKVANIFRLYHGFEMCNKLPQFEKDALVTLGEDIEPELRYLNSCVCGNSDNKPLYNGEKIAYILDRHTVVPTKSMTEMFTFLKQAREARHMMLESRNSRKEVKNQMERAHALG